MSLCAAVSLTWREGESGFMFRMVTHAYCRSSGLQTGRDPIETDDTGAVTLKCILQVLRPAEWAGSN